MTTLPQISLNENWRYQYLADQENYARLDVNDSDWEWTSFAGVPIAMFAESNIVWLRKRFDLLATDQCVRYFLRCEYCAFPMKFYLRGNLIAELATRDRLDIDVTDNLSLDDNLLAVCLDMVELSDESQSKELYLQPVFCKELG